MSFIRTISNTLLAVPKTLWRWLRHYPKRTIATVITVLIVLFGISSCTQTPEPEYVKGIALRADLRQTIEAIGEVISERDLKLQFPITGVVETVDVSEGDRVKAGEQIASLRSSGLRADVASASAQVASARANLEKLQTGNRPEEIAVAEAAVENKRAALASARDDLQTAERSLQQAQTRLKILEQEAEVSLSGTVSTARSTVSSTSTSTETALQAIQGVLDDPSIETAALQFRESYKTTSFQTRRLDIENRLRQARSTAISLTDYKDAITVMQNTRDAITDASALANDYYNFFADLTISSLYSINDRETAKATVSTQLSSIQSAYTSIESALKSLRDAAASYDTRIATEQSNVISAEGSRDRATSDIQTFETSLRIEEAQLALQKAGSRPEDIAAAQASLNQAYAQYSRAAERLEDTIIRAPIDGIVTKIDLKEGELLSTSFASESAITMLGDDPFRVELYIAEIDVPKAQVGQSGSIVLDAFGSQEFSLRLSEVDPTATEVDGVPKYRAKLDFSDPDSRLKIGMTGDVEIITDFRADVLQIPGRAVIENELGQQVVRVLNPVTNEVTEKPVTIGIEGEGGLVEVVSGLADGEIVIELIKE